MVKGMTCGGCVRAVTRAVQAQDKAATVDVDLPSGKVTITGALSRDQAEAAVLDAGFSLAPGPG
jgi:copper chaperone